MNQTRHDALLALASANAVADQAVGELGPAEQSLVEVRAALRQRAVALGEAVNAMFDRDGWPRADQVGEDGQRAFVRMLVGASVDESVLVRCHDLLRAEVATGNAEPWLLAVLEDRLAVARGTSQPYGTIGNADVADPAAVDARRANVGLPPRAVQRATTVARPAAATRIPASRPWLLGGLGVASLALGIGLALA